MDAFDYLKEVGSISGSLPPLGPAGTEISLKDYTEEFTKVQPGLITSNSERKILINPSNQQNQSMSFEVTHTVEYDGCEAEPITPEKRTVRFKSSRNYIVYDPQEEVTQNCEIKKNTNNNNKLPTILRKRCYKNCEIKKNSNNNNKLPTILRKR